MASVSFQKIELQLAILDFKVAPILNRLIQVSFENLAPQVSRQICKELQQLISDPPEGIKVILNEEDISDIQAIIDGPGKSNSHLK